MGSWHLYNKNTIISFNNSHVFHSRAAGNPQKGWILGFLKTWFGVALNAYSIAGALLVLLSQSTAHQQNHWILLIWTKSSTFRTDFATWLRTNILWTGSWTTCRPPPDIVRQAEAFLGDCRWTLYKHIDVVKTMPCLPQPWLGMVNIPPIYGEDWGMVKNMVLTTL